MIRRPRITKGRVDLTLCTPAHDIVQQRITKKARSTYKAARTTRWGDTFNPDNA